jgi:hypothetical protein
MQKVGSVRTGAPYCGRMLPGFAVSLTERVLPEVHRRAPRALQCPHERRSARVGGACGPSGASRGGLSRRPYYSFCDLRRARKSSTDRSGTLNNDPASFLRALLLDSALHGPRLLVREPVGVQGLNARQDLGRGYAGIRGEPSAYLIVQVIQH